MWNIRQSNLSPRLLSILPSLLHVFWLDDTSPPQKRRVTLSNSSCRCSERTLSSEGSNLEDSLHHRFHLLKGRIRKVSESLFCRHFGDCSLTAELLTVQISSQMRKHIRPCMLNVFFPYLRTCWVERWPVSLLTHQRVFVRRDWLSLGGDGAAPKAAVTLMLLNVRGCLLDVHSMTQMYITHAECRRWT